MRAVPTREDLGKRVDLHQRWTSELLIVAIMAVILLTVMFCCLTAMTHSFFRSTVVTKTGQLSPLRMTEIPEFGEDDEIADDEDVRTDQEKGLTHGYEGDFKIGDQVRVTLSTTIYSIPKMEFDCQGMTGIVDSMVLYGRKHQSLCSAITPIKVKFSPGDEGVDEATFPRKFFLHFSANELEKL